VAQARSSSFDEVRVAAIEEHQERIKNDRYMTSLYIEKCFKV